MDEEHEIMLETEIQDLLTGSLDGARTAELLLRVGGDDEARRTMVQMIQLQRQARRSVGLDVDDQTMAASLAKTLEALKGAGELESSGDGRVLGIQTRLHLPRGPALAERFLHLGGDPRVVEKGLDRRRVDMLDRQPLPRDGPRVLLTGKADVVPRNIERPGDVVHRLRRAESGLFEQEVRMGAVAVGGIERNFLDVEVLVVGLERAGQGPEIVE